VLKKLNIRLPKELKAAVKHKARLRNVSMSQIVRECVEADLAREERLSNSRNQRDRSSQLTHRK